MSKNVQLLPIPKLSTIIEVSRPDIKYLNRLHDFFARFSEEAIDLRLLTVRAHPSGLAELRVFLNGQEILTELGTDVGPRDLLGIDLGAFVLRYLDSIARDEATAAACALRKLLLEFSDVNLFVATKATQLGVPQLALVLSSNEASTIFCVAAPVTVAMEAQFDADAAAAVRTQMEHYALVRESGKGREDAAT